LDGIDGPTGNTGTTGNTGPTGPTGLPGDKYLTVTQGSILLDPRNNSSETFTIGTGLSYITSNSVLITDSGSPTINLFEARVSSYNKSSDDIYIYVLKYPDA
jgi:hypothetical protein